MPVHDAEDAPLADRIDDDKEERGERSPNCVPIHSIDEEVLLNCLDSLELSPLIGYKKWTDQSTLTKAKARRFACRLKSTADEIKGFFPPSYFWYLTVQNQKFLWLNLCCSGICGSPQH